jgi:hypothetical protein
VKSLLSPILIPVHLAIAVSVMFNLLVASAAETPPASENRQQPRLLTPHSLHIATCAHKFRPLGPGDISVPPQIAPNIATIRMELQLGETAVESPRICSLCATSGLTTLLPAKNGSVLNNQCVDRTLEPLSVWKLQDCEFCQFLFQCLPAAYRTGIPTEERFGLVFKTGHQFVYDAGVVVRALSYDKIEERNLRLEYSQFVSGKKEPYSVIVLLPNEQWSGIEPTSPMVDYDMVSGWLKTPAPVDLIAPYKRKVAGQHRLTNVTPSRMNSWDRARSGVLDLKLTVIDCTTRLLVILPQGKHYITLSYVWGQSTGQIRRGTARRPDSRFGAGRRTNSNNSDVNSGATLLPSPLPLTIEDSIKVCKALRYRYLWVDRYCIPQQDHQMRARQIQQMDDIYRGSSLTLIACAGEDPHYGLPGVTRPRAPSPSVHMGSRGCLRMVPTVHDIYSSIWASRAWTYQEAVLAQRRLFFTDRQVYFESNDSVDSELTTLAPVVTRVLDPRIYSQVTSSTYSGDIYECIQEFTRRTLSFPSDAMNALSGILTYYGRERDIHHLWGIPYSDHTLASIDEPPRKRVVTFEESLRWYATSGHVRRDGFPSWSWAGWFDEVNWRSWRSDLKPPSAPFEQGPMSIEVELTSGRLLSWAEYQAQWAELNDSSRSETADQLTRFIHVEAFVSPITKKDVTGQNVEESAWNTMSVETTQEAIQLPFEHFSIPAQNANTVNLPTVFQHDSLLALHFPCWEETGKERSGSLLVIRDRGDHWERITLLEDEERRLKHAKKTRMKIRLG